MEARIEIYRFFSIAIQVFEIAERTVDWRQAKQYFESIIDPSNVLLDILLVQR